MKYTSILLLLAVTFTSALHAQDPYHQALITQLATDYNLNGGEFVLSTDNMANNASGWDYGQGERALIDITDQTFSQAVRMTMTQNYENSWNAGWGNNNQKPIAENDICLLVFWARSSNSEEGRLGLFAENNMTYAKEVYQQVSIGNEWRQYFFPYQSSASFDIDAFQLGFHLGALQQQVQFTGLNIINYKSAYSLDDLPRVLNNDVYGGYEADASWRSQAADRIEELRKAPLDISITNTQGTAVPEVGVVIEMLQHEYAFGSAVVSCMFAQNDCQNEIYEEKMLNLDGQGHGFNWVVFENGLKWPNWEGGWPNSQFEKADAIEWLREKDIKVRGYNLLHPSQWALPNDVRLNIDNVDYVLERIDGHLEELLTYPSINGEIEEWDVLNEITPNQFLENSLIGNNGYVTGREIYAEVLKKTRALDAFPKLYINDFMTISSQRSKGNVYDNYQQFIQELIDADAPLDGIGFESHIGTYPTSINQIESILDDFYEKYSLSHKITEFDLDVQLSEETEAAYMHDFLTYVFSHPSTNGFLMWGFWDGAHWNDHAPMFDLDWNLKPAGQAFIDLVFKDWWTNKFRITDSNGQISLSGFKGKYVIQVNCDQIIRDTITLLGNGINLNYTCSELVGANEILKNNVQLIPNPSAGRATLTRSIETPVTLRLMNLQGQVIKVWEKMGALIPLSASLQSGTYLLEISDESGVQHLKWIVQ